jgi:hypothetical protein
MGQDFAQEAIIWVPQGYDSPETWIWDDIPYDGDVTSTPNVATGKGDPCRLAMKDGVVGGYRMPTWTSLDNWDGGMPKSKSQPFDKETIREGYPSPSTVLYNNDHSYFYLANIGYRSHRTSNPQINPPKAGYWSTGVAGKYWAANGYYLDFISVNETNVTVAVNTSRPKENAYAIRCIKAEQ